MPQPAKCTVGAGLAVGRELVAKDLGELRIAEVLHAIEAGVFYRSVTFWMARYAWLRIRLGVGYPAAVMLPEGLGCPETPAPCDAAPPGRVGGPTSVAAPRRGGRRGGQWSGGSVHAHGHLTPGRRLRR